MLDKLLIDSGPSSRGWSYWADFFGCPRLFAYQRLLGIKLGSSDGLTRGSMVHTGMAHLYAAWGTRQADGVLVGTDEGLRRITDASTLLVPDDAIAAWVERHGLGAEYVDRARAVVRHYAATTAPPRGVIGVEVEMHGVLGWRAGRWGLHINNGLTTALGLDMPMVEPTPLDYEGAPGHGEPIIITRRADLIRESRDAFVEVVDHKAHAHVSPARARDEYVMEGGWAPFRIMARQVWGKRYGGRIILNLLQTEKPYPIKEEPVPPAPQADLEFAEDLWRVAHQKAEYEVTLEPWKWPKRRTHCYGCYGLCKGAPLCQYGPAALVDINNSDG